MKNTSHKNVSGLGHKASCKIGAALKLSLLLIAAITFGRAAHAQTYQTVTLSGFNADVVANGATTNPSSTVTTSPYNGLDGVGYVFVSQDFRYSGGAAPAYYLPTSRTLASASISGLTYQLANYAGNNALALHGTSGTLTFGTAVSASQVFVLGTTGSGVSNVTFTVNFTDGTSQGSNTAYYPDWFGTGFEYIVGDRWNLGGNAYDMEYPNPGLYKGTINIASANCQKSISSIGVSQTGGGYLAIMAISVQLAVIPTITSTTPSAECGTGSVSLGATASSGTVNWYTASTGGSSVYTGTSYTTPSISATTTYYVDGTNSGCITPTRTAVTATVNSLPTTSAGAGVAICNGGSTAMTATGGSTYSWSPATGLSATTGATVTASPTATTTYTITGTTASTGCSNTATKTITVNAVPVVSAGSGVAICAGGSATLTATGGTTYSWSPATGLSATTGASVTASPGTTTTYTVTGTNASGCNNTATKTVSVNALPVISAGSNAAICNGNATTLTATGGASYSWANATGLSATTGASVTANPTATTTYTVTGTNASGCIGKASVTVSVNALPVINAGSNVAICNGYATTLTATGGVTYSWANATGLSATTGASVNANPTATTTYTVTGTNASGCSSNASVAVSVNALPVISAGSNVAICNGNATTLTATGGVSYSWASATGLSATTGASVTATPTVTTTYTVTGTNVSGCSSNSSVTVSVNALPVISAGSNVAICNGNATTLTATGGVSYSWASATGLSSVTGASVTANPTANTSYTVTGTNASGCSSNASVTVSVNAIPVISAGSNVAICNGNATALTATGGTSYSWSNATGLSATTGAGVTANPTATTTYTVNGTNASGCNSTAMVTVSVNALPVISAGSNVAICNGNATTLTATGGVSYSWASATGLSSVTGASVTANPTANTSYTVTGADANGCVNTAAVTVSVNAIPTIDAGSGASICNGAIIALTATGGASYSWSPAATLSATTGATVTAGPSATTTYTVVGTSAYGCSNTASVTVSVIVSPAMTSTGNGGAVCAGNTVALNCTATGGTGTLSYSWSGPNTFGSTAQNPSVAAATTSASGTYTVTVTDANGCAATGANTTTATVNPTPSAGTITGVTAVCIGNTVALGSSVSGGVWSAGNTMVSVGSATGTVTGVAVGSVTISYRVTNTYSCSSVATWNMNTIVAPSYIYTCVGNGTASCTGDGGTANMATLRGPRAIKIDSVGNLFISDPNANVIRKVTPAGIITTVAGNGTAGTSGYGGQATAAQLSMAGGGGVYVDNAGNILIANSYANTIAKVNASTGIIKIIAGTGVSGFSGDNGQATAAKINAPLGICEDAAGNIYITDQANYRIRKINAVTGVITTIVGTGYNAYYGDGGQGTAAALNYPRDIVSDNSGNIFIADASNNVVRKYVIATGIITTVAGTGAAGSTGDGGAAIAAKLSSPSRVAVDAGNNLYISDQANGRVRKVDMNTGIITTAAGNGAYGYAGDGGAAVIATLGQPYGIACDKNGYLYIADGDNHRIRVTATAGSLKIVLAGPASVASGTPVTFNASSAITNSYSSLQWQKNGVNVGTGGTTYTNATPANGDVYRCILNVTPECGVAYSDTSNAITISVAGARFSDTTVTLTQELNVTANIKIFPNPAHDHLNIEAAGMENGNIQINVFDQLGRVVMSKTADVSGNQLTEKLDMASVPAGMYIISLTDSTGKNSIIKCVKN